MFNGLILTIISFFVLIAVAYFNAELFIKYELEGVKKEKLHAFTAIFSLVALVGAIIILGILISYIA